MSSSKALDLNDLIKFLQMPTREMYAALPSWMQQAGRMAAVPVRKMNRVTPTPVKVAVTLPVVASIPVIPLGMVIAVNVVNGASRLLMPIVRQMEEQPNTRITS